MCFFDFDEEEPRTKRRKFSKGEKETLFKIQKGKCMYCGKKMEMAYFDVDHKKPVAKGGKNRITNLQLLCRPCNARKGKMTDGEFRRRYKLTPSTKAKGPPSRVIPQKHFEGISATTSKRKAKASAKRRKEEQDDDIFGGLFDDLFG